MRSDVLDLCAAPGGKTMQLAAAGHDVTAVDASESRLERLRENLERTQLKAELVDGRRARMEAQTRSSTPSCSTRPARRRAPSAAIPKCSTAPARASSPKVPSSSAQLLDRAAQWLKPGGTLVYSVCSLEPRGRRGCRSRLPRRPSGLRIDSLAPGNLPDFVPPSLEGWVRILPGLLEARGRARRLLHGAACPHAVNPV